MKLISDFKRSPFVIIAEETRIYCRDVEYSLFSQKCSKTFEEPHSLLSLKFINRLVIIEKTGARRSRRVAFEVLVTRSRVRERCDAVQTADQRTHQRISEKTEIEGSSVLNATRRKTLYITQGSLCGSDTVLYAVLRGFVLSTWARASRAARRSQCAAIICERRRPARRGASFRERPARAVSRRSVPQFPTTCCCCYFGGADGLNSENCVRGASFTSAHEFVGFQAEFRFLAGGRVEHEISFQSNCSLKRIAARSNFSRESYLNSS